MPFWPARLLTHKMIRLTVQNKKRVLFGERELVLCFNPFIAESEQAVIEEKVCEGALFRSLVDRTSDGYEGLVIETLRVHYRSYVAELRDTALLITTLLLELFLGPLQKTRGQGRRPGHPWSGKHYPTWRCKVAFLELLAAATRAKVVPPHLHVQILAGCLAPPSDEEHPPMARRATPGSFGADCRASARIMLLTFSGKGR
jgi:hypothetical protein